ncbi:MAG: type II toxin-antitoxin system VapC family toxin [Terriglobales bacterium]|jgi:predicted nucleic acid-binding protein
MAGSLYLLDTNILLRWVQPRDSDYGTVAAALDVLARDGAILCYTSQNLGEFWNACTRPLERNGFGLSPHDAGRKARLFETRLRLLQENPSVHDEWRQILLTYNVSGNQVHDARLVAVMRVHDVGRILTFNEKDFVRYSSIQAVNPRLVS